MIKGIFFLLVFCFGSQSLLNAQTLHIPANDAYIALRVILYPILSADSVVKEKDKLTIVKFKNMTLLEFEMSF